MKYAQPYGVLDPNAGYVNGDPSVGRAGSIPPAAAFEEPMREIVKCITGCGLTPTDSDLTQLWQALQIGPWINEYAADTGSANVYSASITPVPAQLYLGMRVAVKIGNANTGPSTLNINGLGAHAIKRASGADIVSGDLKTGQVGYFIFDGAYWQIINFLGFTSDTTINNFTLQIPYAVDTGAVNAIAAVFSPAVTVLAAGNPFLIKVMNTNAGPVSIKPNALAAVQLVWPDQSQLAPGDIVAGGMIFVVFDGTKFQLFNRINAGGGAPTTPPTTTGVPGTIDLWPTETPPTGAYECNGQALSRINDARLYGIIGTMYGSPDPSSFRVPDLRGQFVRGWSHSSGVDPDAASRTNRGDGAAGDHVGTKQADQIRSHSHSFSSGGSLSLDFRNSPQAWDPFGNSLGICSGVAAHCAAVEGNNSPIGGGGGGNLDIAGVISGIAMSMSGSTDPTGGTETRPTNVNLMYVMWR